MMMSGNDDKCVMRSLCARTILEHQKRARENEAFAMTFLFDDAEVALVVPGTGPGAGTVTSKDMQASAAIVCPIAAHPSVASDDPVACDRASVEILPSAPVTSGDAAELGAASGAAAEGAAPVPIKRKRGRQRKLVVDNAENAADASSQEPAQSKGSQESRPGICTSPPPGASVWDDPEFLLFGFWVAGESSNLPDCSRLNLECGKRRRQHAYA